MAAKPSANQRQPGGDLNQPGPRKGALPRANQAASPTTSGSRTQAARTRSGRANPPRPSTAGGRPNPGPSSRAPARKSASSPGSEARNQSKGALPPTGRANSDSRAAGKVSPSVNQPGQRGSLGAKSINEQRAAEIEKETRGQRENPKWFKWRSNRITASVAHRISHCKFVNGKSNEIPQSYLKSIVGQGCNVMTLAMKWGIDNEPVAIKKYEEVKSRDTGREIEVRPCGLFIDPAKNWLAASPDGVVVDKATWKTVGLLEVKCPYKHRNHSITKACEDRNFCLERREKLQLKKNHLYFTQIQCQMAITGISKADLVVYTNRDIAVVPLTFDEQFWQDTVEKLEDFYIRAVLPKIQEENPVLAREE